MLKRKFIKNVIDVDVDPLNGVNTYTIKAMYDQDQEGGYATIEHELVDTFDISWEEIERDGGIVQVNQDLRECYNLEI